jgi:NADPH:quinone reductase-like Zn-dependent oxidoreductase
MGMKADDLGIRAFSGGSPHPLTEEQSRWRLEAMPVVLALIAAGRFSVELGERLGLADAAEAHRIVERGTRGKLILIP